MFTRSFSQAGESGPAVLRDGQLPPVRSKETVGAHHRKTLIEGIHSVLTGGRPPCAYKVKPELIF